MVRKKRNKKSIIIGFLFLIISMAILMFQIILKNFNIEQENLLIEEFIKQEIIKEPEITSEIGDSEEKPINKVNYNMLIKIPKIGLEKGLYNINSKYNSVNYGIEILKISDMPDKINGNLILASHSGNSSVSYFNKLDKLSIDDKVYILFNKVQYVYELKNIYEVKKTGEVELVRPTDGTILALITCKKNSDKQIVYILFLINKGNYNG